MFEIGLPLTKRYFPFNKKITEMREPQIIAADKISNTLLAGHRRLVICGPPGVGKSAIGVMVGNFVKDVGLKTTYTSPLNTLVDQLETSFPESVYTLKGRHNYNCEFGKRNGVDMSCSDGLCKVRLCATKSMLQSDLLIPVKKDCKGCNDLNKCICVDCEYNNAKDEFQRADIGNTNFTMYRFGLRHSDCVIIDECEQIESFLRMELGVTITERWPVSMTWEEYLAKIEDLLERKMLELDRQNLKLRTIRNSDNPLDVSEYTMISKGVEKLKSEISKLNGVIKDYSDNKEPWVNIVENYTDRHGKEHFSMRFEPITVDRFITGTFNENQLVVFMSATPIIPEGWKVIELKSPFPKEIRPWIYDPVGKMTWVERERTIPKLADYIIKLQKKRPGKILVHCVSYPMARTLADSLYERGITHVTLQNNHDNLEGMRDFDVVTRSKAVSNFLNSGNTNQIFCSVNMEAGIDLYHTEGIEAVFTQIIAKVPFQNPTDPVVQAKKKHLKNADALMNMEVARKLMQAYGRINRNPDKQTLTIITDSSFGPFYSRNRRNFFEFFKEGQIKIDNVRW